MSKFSLFKKNPDLGKLLKESNKSKNFFEKDKSIFQRSSDFFKEVFNFSKIDEELQEKLEEAFILLDFGPYLSTKLSKKIVSKYFKNSSIKEIIKQELLNEYGENDDSVNIKENQNNVILVVGSNGTGKTTSIAKLAYRYKNEGYRALLVAGDTFRSGAVEQLKSWSDEMNLDIVTPAKQYEDPSSLIYKSLSANLEGKYNLIICDTSGRQHNNDNLLRELEKIYRTIRKFDTSFPQETLLVVDANTGQSGILQAQKFSKSAEVTGLIISKMDSMTRGGIIFSIKSILGIPVKFIGVGETLDSLVPFNIEEIVDSWIANIDI